MTVRPNVVSRASPTWERCSPFSSGSARCQPMRNILVHDYVDVDPARVWGAVDGRLDDLRAAEKAIAALPELGSR